MLPSTALAARPAPSTSHTFSSVLQEIPNTFTKAVATKTFCPLSGRLAARHRALATAITSATEVFRGEVRELTAMVEDVKARLAEGQIMTDPELATFGRTVAARFEASLGELGRAGAGANTAERAGAGLEHLPTYCRLARLASRDLQEADQVTRWPTHLVTWPVTRWPVVTLLPGHLVTWLSGHLVTWSPGHLVTWFLPSNTPRWWGAWRTGGSGSPAGPPTR